MKINSLLVLGALLSTSSVVWSHTAAHLSRPAARAVVDEALGLEETAIPVQTHEERWWGVNVNTGWESRHVHYGVDESGPTGAYVNEAGLSLGDLSFNAWNGVGTGNTLVEWDFTVAYNIEAGPVFIVPGYNLRSVPSFATGGEDDGHGEHEKEDGTDDHAGHTHNTIGHELLVALGTTAIHYVTPSANFIWDLNNNPGGFLELRLDGHVPVYADIVSLQPYALLGLNFGYNTTEYYGWNNFQFGLQTTCQLAEHVAVFAGVNYSVALEAMREIGQDNIVWVNLGLSFAY